MRKPLALAGVPLLLLLAGCGDSDTGSPSASTPATNTTGSTEPTGAVGVEVKGTAALKFEPETLTAANGQKFEGRLVQVGAVPHNIEIKEFGVNASDTQTTKDGETKSFSFTPDKTGEFKYVCTLHPGTMTGKLTVT